MAWRLRGVQCILLGLLGSSARGKTCFKDAIQPADRVDITMDGVSMPIGVWDLYWDSGLIFARIFQILASEKLGYNVEILGGSSNSNSVVFRLAGCNESDVLSASCFSAPRRFHFSFESWGNYQQYVPTLLKELGDRGPVNLGGVGYPGTEGLHVLGGAINRALSDRGLSLLYYRNYNADWFRVNDYTARVSDVNLSRLGTCDDGVNTGYGFFASDYLAATGDTEGVYTTTEGEVRFKCWQEKWWVSPACRNAPQNCSTLTTGWPGWGMGHLVQAVAFHNMPIALGVALPGEYVSLGKELQSFIYWWQPDVGFVEENATTVILPPHDPAAYLKGVFSSAMQEYVLTKWSASGLPFTADRALALARSMSIRAPEIRDILRVHASLMQNSSSTHWDSACAWLLQNSTPEIWEPWVPSDTACTRGSGLVDANGQYVMERASAVGCTLCPVGTRSQESGETRICQACPTGRHQSLPGEAFCEPCEAGSIAPQEGMMECQPCGLGNWTDEPGMSECHRCGEDVTSNQLQLELFTTSKKVSTGESGEMWIQVQGASSRQLCECREGAHMVSGLCVQCPEGSACVGSALTLLPGYYSPADNVGLVFKCKKKEYCPGGYPGTCAVGRDFQSVACSACLPGLHAQGGECVPCEGGDYALVSILLVLLLVATTIAYFAFAAKDARGGPSQSFIIVSCSMGQLAVSLQVISLIHQFGLNWSEPIASLMTATEIMVLELNFLSIDCLTPENAVTLFSFHAMVLPLLLVVLCLIHFFVVVVRRGKTWQLHQLTQVLGSSCIVIFISFCSSLMPPLICQTHPNQLSTVRAYPSVFCGDSQHLTMVLISSFGFLLPFAFLAFSFWLVLQVPSRLKSSDLRFMRGCSFLFGRFRPGAEPFAVWLLLRNAVLVLLPLAPQSAGTFVMTVVLALSAIISAAWKPWHMMACNWLDVFLTASTVFISSLGLHVAGEVNEQLTIVACLTLLILMFTSILGLIVYGAFKFCTRNEKTYKFFISHHKSKAGSVARWLKMLLLQRGKRFTTFVDCDNLSDLTKLFWHLSHETATCIVLLSPDILKRKWCVGEIATARLHGVHSVMIAWPDYVKPDEAFINDYTTLVPDIVHLVHHNISLADVQESMVDVVNKLTGTSPHIKRLSDDTEKVQSCCIMADPGNFEAVAAAFVISDLINLHFMRSLTSQTVVMMQGDNVPDNTLYAVVVCSGGCFDSVYWATWMVQLGQKPCMALPVFADEDFQVPGHDLYMHLASNPHLRDMAPVLAMTIRAVFEEIGIMCLVQMASQEELDLRARQIVTRFTQKPPLPLPSKLGNRKPPAHFNTEALEVVEIHPQHPGLADHYNLEHNEEMVSEAL
ncbi:unnamed protein product [Durusdinium trenchii]|uniref:Uncharacterized protein n=1 Tax=Durusdinium trenchii TaxID=1381693 RepID=A0ABP0PVT3_9DINO